MIYTPTPLHGACLIDIEKIEDDRGFFARAWCREEFEKHGLRTHFAQINVGSNTRKGTLRGMHYQVEPHAEVKVVRCTRGKVFDVIVAVVVGGTSIYGGEGSFLGMILGALIIGFVGNTLNLLNVMFFYQTVLKGLILVGAVLLTRVIKERQG